MIKLLLRPLLIQIHIPNHSVPRKPKSNFILRAKFDGVAALLTNLPPFLLNPPPAHILEDQHFFLGVDVAGVV